MYKIGTYVSYRSEGVCVVTEIKNQSFGSGNEAKNFYVLSPINDVNSKIYVPTDNDSLVSQMQPLCSADDVNALADRLREQRMEWINESRPRNNALRTIIAEGNRERLILFVNTALDRIPLLEEQGKHLTQGDELMLKKAIRMLVDEFSVTTDISSEEALIAVLLGKTKCKSKE